MLLYPGIIIGKILIFLSRNLHLGGGSSFPGRLALRICPRLLALLAARFSRGVILVTATNGKTTTTRMLAMGFREAGIPVVYNISGANMAGGIATAMIEAVSFRGRFRAPLGLFEVDEGSFAAVAPAVGPSLIVVGNFFRDQLDRYGEVAILAARVGETLRTLENKPRLLFNADDPIVASLAVGYDGPVTAFGLDCPELALEGEQNEADIRNCPLCHAFLEYERVYLGHLGHYRCPGCGFSRPVPACRAGGVRQHGLASQEFVFTSAAGEVSFSVLLPGRHAVYNFLTALAVLSASGVDVTAVRERFARFVPPYGRFERFTVDGKHVYLILIKNPAGANVVLQMLAEAGLPPGGVFCLNDLAADGRDVSWIYDARFELVAGLSWALCGGRRAGDMALRMVYAGLPEAAVEVREEYGELLQEALARTPAGATLPVLATYTAMHRVRAALAALTTVSDFWED